MQTCIIVNFLNKLEKEKCKRGDKNMAMNPMKLFQIKSLWDKFTGNHPKFPKFLQAIGTNGVREGSVIEITVTTPEGTNISSNLKITAADMELIQTLKEIAGDM